MSKHQKGPMRKYVRMAAEARKERNLAYAKLVLAVAMGVAVWGVFSFTDLNTHTQFNSILIFLFVILVVVVIGEVGVKASKYMTEYTKLKNQYGITDKDVREFNKSNR